MTGADAPRAGRREWIGLAVIALPCVLYSMDLTVLYLAVPSLAADLGPSSTELLWITDIYGFFLAGFLITMGTLGDRIGRRRLLLIGAAAFGIASVLAAFSTTVETLIVSRALLGVAAATLAPSTLSLIRNMFLDPGQRTFAIGVWTTSFAAGAAIGPLLGGILLDRRRGIRGDLRMDVEAGVAEVAAVDRLVETGVVRIDVKVERDVERLRFPGGDVLRLLAAACGQRRHSGDQGQRRPKRFRARLAQRSSSDRLLNSWSRSGPTRRFSAPRRRAARRG